MHCDRRLGALRVIGMQYSLAVLCKLILLQEVTVKDLLAETAARAARYITEIDNRPVTPRAETIARLRTLGGPLPAFARAGRATSS